MPSSNIYCFTINNPDESDKPVFKPSMSALVYQLERGSEGTEHYQGVVRYKKRTPFRVVSRDFSRAHIEVCRSWEHSVEYCQKAETRIEGPFIYGKIESGVPYNVDEIPEFLSQGGSERDLATERFGLWSRHHRAIRKYVELCINPRSTKPRVWVLFGETGTGKTYNSIEYANSLGGGVYIKERGKWWDGYSQERVCILDEFYGWIPFGTLLRIIDRYPVRVEYKGGMTQFTSELIIFTSNVRVEEWYKDEYLPALFRRIDRIVECFHDKWVFLKN